MIITLSILLGVVLVALVLSWVYLIGYKNRVGLSISGAVEAVRQSCLEERDGALQALREELESSLKAQLEDAGWSHKQGLARQRGEVWGRAAEKLTPLFGEWRLQYNPDDLVLVSNTVDYLVLVGRSEGRVTRIVFQEIKSGKAKETVLQQSLRECIEEGRVEWDTWRFDEEVGELFKEPSPALGKWILKLIKEGYTEEEIKGRVKELKDKGK